MKKLDNHWPVWDCVILGGIMALVTGAAFPAFIWGRNVLIPSLARMEVFWEALSISMFMLAVFSFANLTDAESGFKHGIIPYLAVVSYFFFLIPVNGCTFGIVNGGLFSIRHALKTASWCSIALAFSGVTGISTRVLVKILRPRNTMRPQIKDSVAK